MKNFLLIWTLFPLMAFAQSFQPLPDFPGAKRGQGVAEYFDGKIYAGTGFAEGFFTLNDWWEYDLTTQNWTQLPDVPFTERQYVASCVARNSIFLIAGWNNNNLIFNDFWKYIPNEKAWEQMPYFPAEKRWNGAAVSVGSSIYFGFGTDTSQLFADWWKFDLESGLWNRLADFPDGGRRLMVAENVGNQIIVGLGRDENGHQRNDFWEYQIENDVWKKLALEFPDSLTYAASASMHGKMYLAGGVTNSDKIQTDYHIVDFHKNEVKTIKNAEFRQGRSASLVATKNCQQYLLFGLDTNLQRINDFWEISVPSEVQALQLPVIQTNPIFEFLEVSLPETWQNLQILNSTGKIIYQNSAGNCAEKIDVSNYKNGMYFLRYSFGKVWSNAAKFLKAP